MVLNPQPSRFFVALTACFKENNIFLKVKVFPLIPTPKSVWTNNTKLRQDGVNLDIPF